MIAILGSGFGLYGYLPALVHGCSQRVVLPERYRPRFNERAELDPFAKDVRWKQDETAVLGCASGVVLALRPIDQVEWIRRCLALDNIEFLLLEKPLAINPEGAGQVFDDLVNSHKVFRIGYTFRFTDWGKRLLHELASICQNGFLSIHWTFMAHHFSHELRIWKRFDSQGGGVLRFYGIQVIALLAECGYTNVVTSKVSGKSADEADKWLGVFTGPRLPECEVVVDTMSPANVFRVEQLSMCDKEQITTVFAILKDPFESKAYVGHLDGNDRRVPILAQHCNSLWEDSENKYQWYVATIQLWKTVEFKTEFVQSL